MPTRRTALIAGFVAAAPTSVWLASALAAQPAVPAPYREIKWTDLVPKEWDPFKSFKNRNPGVMSDGDPRAGEMLKEMRAVWDNAPTNQAVDGASIKLPGYVVPLEELRGELKEFLLVPYFGACIHTPPPPANQIVLVVAKVPVKGFRAMDTVWVSGLLRTLRTDSYMGSSGYRLEAALVERYVEPPR